MHPETSAQVTSDAMNVIIDQQSEQTPGFETYCSLLDRHPLLRANTRQEACSLDLSASSSSVSNGSFSNTTHVDIDLKPLKQAAVMQYLSDNSRQICQYELGGGECRDKNCENVHLSRISAVEPTDEDTAQYLCSSIPSGQRYGVDVFRKALDVARLSHPTMPFDARVQEALTRLGLR
ncbi:hypothetical protein C8Q76DRAFT_735044 [Earliella scabrosa]|nr:hypothetical protein C8Q76DRAFT_735044 [Earliella scabrosa]